jgi:hypothetical protein
VDVQGLDDRAHSPAETKRNGVNPGRKGSSSFYLPPIDIFEWSKYKKKIADEEDSDKDGFKARDAVPQAATSNKERIC